VDRVISSRTYIFCMDLCARIQWNLQSGIDTFGFGDLRFVGGDKRGLTRSCEVWQGLMRRGKHLTSETCVVSGQKRPGDASEPR